MSSVRVTLHHHYQLELKVVHALEPPQGERSFEAWFFFPPSLGIDEPTFQKEVFYDEVTSYVRFQTPRMSLDQLFAENEPKSPFAWLARNGARLTSGTATEADFARALRELRLGAAVFRASVRDHARFVASELGSGAPPAVLARHAEASSRFHSECCEALERYRALRLQFLDARTPALLRTAIDAIDDFLSVQVLEGWFSLLETFNVHAQKCGALVAALRTAIATETAYRKSAGHLPAPADDASTNERFVARVNLLKKWVLAVLHLRVRSSRRAELAQDALFAIAAAVAMVVAVSLQLIALWTVGTPSSPQVGGATVFTFVALAVAGYILKDRLKERLKVWFQKGIPYWLFDRRQELRVEAGGASIGSVEETVRLLRAAELVPLVARLRDAGEEPLFAEQRGEEDVIHYRRKLRIDGSRARAQAPEMSAIDEILRLNVTRWLRRMDDPDRALLRLTEDNHVLVVTATKTYRVTLIVARGGAERRYEKYSIVLTRDGIERVEQVGGI
ncbi:MAG: hypothetical protein Q8P18_00345 [Pseudomonadota bacterium]|nr:hypothetical protein [Pseudomonadota bacterium]